MVAKYASEVARPRKGYYRISERRYMGSEICGWAGGKTAVLGVRAQKGEVVEETEPRFGWTGA